MKHQLPTIADIQTTELLYYDADLSEKCYRFCKDRDIDCLPDASEPGKYYRRRDDSTSFDRIDTIDELRLEATTYIFQPELAEQFRKRPVQFVYMNGVLTGVVHFSDYNREVVYTYLYAELASYERDLRELLVLSNLNNDDMYASFWSIVNHHKSKGDKEETVRTYLGKIDDYDKKREKLEKIPAFQGFQLDDLRTLAKKREVIELEDIRDLRNQVMHARDSVEQVNARVPDFIYEDDSFASFFDKVQLMLKDRRRIQTRQLLLQKANGR